MAAAGSCEPGAVDYVHAEAEKLFKMEAELLAVKQVREAENKQLRVLLLEMLQNQMESFSTRKIRNG